MLSYEKMVGGKKYFIYQPQTKYYNCAFYKGFYVSKHRSYLNQPIAKFDYVVELVKDESGTRTEFMGTMNFGRTELYYDPEILKENAKRARQAMEKRALDTILKRAVDQNFTWY